MCLMTDVSAIRTFVNAGRAVFTLSSKLTGDHMTWRVKLPKRPGMATHYCELRTHRVVEGDLVDADDYGNWEYRGIIHRGVEYERGHKCKREDARADRTMAWFWRKVIVDGVMPPQLEFRHEGKCGRCSRPLTDPVSIDRGIGPDCWGVINDAEGMK